MNSIIKIILIVTLSPIVGCLLSGLDRKITARLQSRVGPPLLQPLYDILKLMSKENTAVSRFQNLYIFFYFAFVAASLIMLFFQMDLLMIVFVFTIANIALIAGGMSTGSPYSKIGSQREIVAMLSYEPVLIFFVIGMYMLTGSFRINGLNYASKPIIYFLPLIFVSMLFIMNIKFKKSPFDFSSSHHAHQELVKGILTEYSGPALGIIELTHWYETVFLLGLMFIFWKQSIAAGLFIAVFTYIFTIALDNITARLTWQWMLKATWTVPVSLSILNIVIIYVLNIKLV